MIGTSSSRPATERQMSLLLQLVQERPGAKAYVDTQLAANRVQHPSQLSASEMSNVIGVVMDMPKAEVPKQAEVQAGVYWLDGDQLVRVYLGQQSGKMLVKRVHVGEGDVSYEYLGAASRIMTGSYTRLSLEEVGRLGVVTGTCMICGRRLDDPESVDRGIGPVCATRY